MNIRVVSFDLDGTLYPYSQLVRHALRLFVRYPVFAYHFAAVRKKVRQIRPVADLHRLQADLLAERLGITEVECRSRIDTVIYGEWIRCFTRVRPFEHVEGVLQGFRSRGKKLALLSDYPVTEKIGYLGLSDYWDATITSESTHYLKPNPEPFQEILSFFHCRAEEVLYVGDNYYYDVMGAHSVGMKTAHLTRFPRRNSVATFTFHNYREFDRLTHGL